MGALGAAALARGPTGSGSVGQIGGVRSLTCVRIILLGHQSQSLQLDCRLLESVQNVIGLRHAALLIDKGSRTDKQYSLYSPLKKSGVVVIW